MSDRFIKFIPSEESMWLLKNHPNAMSLLMLIASRVRWHESSTDGLNLGECHIGDHEACGLSRQEYRTALKLLTSRLHVKMIENCRTRQKSTTGTTTYGTKVKLISSNVYDVNISSINHRTNQPATTDQPPTNHEQRKIKKEKECKESSSPTPSFDDDDESADIFFIHAKKWSAMKDIGDLITENTRGMEVRYTMSDIFRYFCSKPYSTEVVLAAIDKFRHNPYKVNNLYKYLESICVQIQENETQNPPIPQPVSFKDEKLVRFGDYIQKGG